MNKNKNQQREILEEIANRAMLEEDCSPTFPLRQLQSSAKFKHLQPQTTRRRAT